MINVCMFNISTIGLVKCFKTLGLTNLKMQCLPFAVGSKSEQPHTRMHIRQNAAAYPAPGASRAAGGGVPSAGFLRFGGYLVWFVWLHGRSIRFYSPESALLLSVTAAQPATRCTRTGPTRFASCCAVVL